MPATAPRVKWDRARREICNTDVNERNAASLLIACGVLRLDRTNCRLDKVWLAEHVDHSLLVYLVGLQQAIRGLKARGVEAIRTARASEGKRQTALAELHRQSLPKTIALSDESILRYKRENPGIGFAAGFAEVINHVAEGPRPIEQMPAYRPLRAVEALDSADIGTRLLLNLEGVTATFTLDENAFPVVSLIPTNPLAQLLLAAYSDALFLDIKLCAKPRCGRNFRGRGSTCSDGCADYLKKVRNRMIDRALRECKELDPVDSSTACVVQKARTFAEALAGGPVSITPANVERRKTLKDRKEIANGANDARCNWKCI